MLSWLAAAVLSRLIGPYVKGLTSETLRVALWKGDLELENVELKEDAINNLLAPALTVKGGSIGYLRIQVPWNHLGSEPVVIFLDRTYLLLEAGDVSEWDAEEQVKRALKAKLEKLAASEILKKVRASETDGPASSGMMDSSYLAKIGALVVDNVQLIVNNIHIRVEDTLSAAQSCGFGVTIESISAQSTNENFDPVFVVEDTGVCFKAIRVTRFAVYWDVDADQLAWGEGVREAPDFSTAMEKLTVQSPGPVRPGRSNLNHIIEPCCATLHVSFRKAKEPDYSQPRARCCLRAKRVGIRIDDRQLHQLANLGARLAVYPLRERYGQFRPLLPVLQAPRQWWVYAIRSVLLDVHRERARWSWDAIVENRDSRKLYVDLYLEVLRSQADGASVGAEVKRGLSDLETRLKYEDIMCYRWIAERRCGRALGVNLHGVNAESDGEEASPKEQERRPGETWLSWLLGGTMAQDELDEYIEEEHNTDSPSTLEIRSLLGELDPDAVIAEIKPPKGYAEALVQAEIEDGSITVLAGGREVIYVPGKGLKLEAALGLNVHAKFQVGWFEVHDRVTRGCAFPTVLTPHERGGAGPMVEGTVDVDPEDPVAEAHIRATLAPVRIMAAAQCWTKMDGFLSFPDVAAQERLAMNAFNTLETFAARVSTKLDILMNTGASVDLGVTIRRPTFIHPVDPTDTASDLLVVRASELVFCSNVKQKRTKSAVAAVRRAVRNYASEEEYPDWTEIFYDDFMIYNRDLEATLHLDRTATAAGLDALDETPDCVPLLAQPVDVTAKLRVAVLTNDPLLTKARVEVDVSPVHVVLTDTDYNRIVYSALTNLRGLSARRQRARSSIDSMELVVTEEESLCLGESARVRPGAKLLQLDARLEDVSLTLREGSLPLLGARIHGIRVAHHKEHLRDWVCASIASVVLEDCTVPQDTEGCRVLTAPAEPEDLPATSTGVATGPAVGVVLSVAQHADTMVTAGTVVNATVDLAATDLNFSEDALEALLRFLAIHFSPTYDMPDLLHSPAPPAPASPVASPVQLPPSGDGPKVKVDVEVSCRQVRASLHQSRCCLVTARMAGVRVSASGSNEAGVSAGLVLSVDEVGVRDWITYNSQHRAVLQCGGGGAQAASLEARVGRLVSNDEDTSTASVRRTMVSVSGRVAPVRCTLLLPFAQALATYMDKMSQAVPPVMFPSPREVAAIKASLAPPPPARAEATDPLGDAMGMLSGLSLDVDVGVDSPVLVLPCNPALTDAFEICLGQISVANGAGGADGTGAAGVVVKIEGASLATVMMDERQGCGVVGGVARVAVGGEAPEFNTDVSFSLTDGSVTLTRSQYALLCSVVTDNFAEALQSSSAPGAASPIPSPSSSPAMAPASPLASPGPAPTTGPGNGHAASSMRLQASIRAPAVRLVLCEDGMAGVDPGQAAVELEVRNVSVATIVETAGVAVRGAEGYITVGSMHLRDVRPNVPAAYRHVAESQWSPGGARKRTGPLAKVAYTLERSGSHDVEVLVDAMRVLVNPDTVAFLAAFLATPVILRHDLAVRPSPSSDSLSATSPRRSPRHPASPAAPADPAPLRVPRVPLPEVTARIEVTACELWVVESAPAPSAGSRAGPGAGSSSFVVRLDRASGLVDVAAEALVTLGVEGCGVQSRQHHQDKETVHHVVDPFSLSAQVMRAAGSGPGQVVSAGQLGLVCECGAGVRMWVSYRDVCMAARIAESARAAIERYNLKDLEHSVVVGDDQQQPSWADGDEGRAGAGLGPLLLLDSVAVTVPKVGMTIINDCFEHQNTPVLEWSVEEVEVLGEVMPGPGDMAQVVVSARTSARLSCHAYNQENISWEPIVEPWTVRARAEVQLANVVPALATGGVTVEAPDRLNVNVTEAFLCGAVQTLMTWSADFKANDAPARPTLPPCRGPASRLSSKLSSLRPGFWPYVIVNECGAPLRYWLSGQEYYDVDTGAVSTFEFITGPHTHPYDRELGSAGGHMVSVRVKGWLQLRVPIDRVGKYIFSLAPDWKARRQLHRGAADSEPAPEKLYLVCEVMLSDGCKVISVRSVVTVENHTQIPMEVMMGGHVVGTVHPAMPLAVPLAMSHTSAISMRPAPAEGAAAYEWTDIVHTGSWQDRSRSPKETHHLSTQAADTSRAIRFIMEISPSIGPGPAPQGARGTGDWVIAIRPALEIENVLPGRLLYRIRPRRDAGGAGALRGEIASGETVQGYELGTGRDLQLEVKIDGYEWSAPLFLDLTTPGSNETEHLVVHATVPRSTRQAYVSLSVDLATTSAGTSRAVVYCHYWVVNRTSLVLQYGELVGGYVDKGSVVVAEGDGAATSAPAPPSPGVAPAAFQSPSKTTTSAGLHQLLSPSGDGVASNSAMFSFRTHDEGVMPRGAVRVADSAWSHGLQFDSVGLRGSLHVDRETEGQGACRRYNLGMRIDAGSGRFFRTKLVTFLPRYILVNRTGRGLLIKQKDTNGVFLIRDGERHPYHWYSNNAPMEVCARFDEPGWCWSGGLQLEQVGDVHVKIRAEDPARPSYIGRAELTNDEATVVVVFRAEQPKIPPYRIDNRTGDTLLVCQKRSQTDFESIPPRSSLAYAWDDPDGPRRLVVETKGPSCSMGVYSIDAICSHPSVELPSGRIVHVRVKADGPTRVLQFSGGADSGADSDEADDAAELAAEETGPLFTLEVVLAGLGVSLIDREPREIIYGTVTGMGMRVSVGAGAVQAEGTVGSLQLDNQLPGCKFPVIAGCDGTASSSAVHLSVVKRSAVRGVDFFRYLSFLLQTVDVHLEEEVLYSVLGMASRVQASVPEGLDNIYLRGPLDGLRNSIVHDIGEQKRVYFELLHLHPVQLNVSFVSSPASVIKDFEHPLLPVFRAISSYLANVDNATLCMNALILEHPYATVKDIVSQVGAHFTRQGVYEMYKLVGAADFLGNPIGLIKNLGTGVIDLFYEPAYALVQSPQEFQRGLAKGAGSLVANSVHGVFNAASKISGSLSRGLASLSMDEDYIRERAREAEGSLLGGIVHGLTGLVAHPVHGAEQEGLVGFGKGVVKGTVGVVLKPIVGVLDVASFTTRAITDATGRSAPSTVRTRVRGARYFGPDGILRPYSEEEVLGVDILASVEGGKFKGEGYVFHTPLGGSMMLLLTHWRLAYVSVGDLVVEWDVKYSDIVSKDVVGPNLRLLLMGFGVNVKTSAPFLFRTLPCADEDTARWVDSQIDSAAGHSMGRGGVPGQGAVTAAPSAPGIVTSVQRASSLSALQL